jgi:hypothetical protein
MFQRGTGDYRPKVQSEPEKEVTVFGSDRSSLKRDAFETHPANPSNVNMQVSNCAIRGLTRQGVHAPCSLAIIAMPEFRPRQNSSHLI